MNSAVASIYVFWDGIFSYFYGGVGGFLNISFPGGDVSAVTFLVYLFTLFTVLWLLKLVFKVVRYAFTFWR